MSKRFSSLHKQKSQFSAILLCLSIIFYIHSNAQIAIPSAAAVTENFTIGTTATASLPSNWKMTAAGTASPTWSSGTNVTATTQAASSGAPATGGRYNWGNGTTTTDRAIGFMTSGGYASPNSIMAFYQNTSGVQINDLTITFDYERYRINTAACTITFFTSTDGTNWTARTAGDNTFTTGTSAYDFTTGTVASKSVTITGVNIANSGNFYLRWNFNTTGASSQGVGLDNVSLTATLAASGTPILSTPTVASITTTGATLGATITSDGGAAISARGTQYALTVPGLTTAALNPEGGTAISSYTMTYASTFTPNTLYYFRGYATNTNGNGFSANSSFTSLHNAPAVGTATSINSTTFTANWAAPTGGGSATFTYEIQVDDDILFGSVNFTQSSISSGTLTASVTGLSGGTTYYYRVRAVNAGGNSAWSSTSAAVNTPSGESIVVDNTNYASGTPEFNINTAYESYTDATSTTTGKIIAMKFKVQDGGADLTDGDALSTILTDIKFTVVDAAATSTSRLSFIKTAILTNTSGTVISTATKVGSELVFSGMSGTNVTAIDGNEKIIHLRISFDETQVIDNVKLLYTVSSVSSSSGTSSFASANGGGAQSDVTTSNDRNRIEITTDRLRFSTQPVDGTTNVNLSTFVVQAQDVNSKVDVDFNTTFTLTTSGTGMTSGSPYILSSGSASISDVQFSSTQTNITLTATTAGLANDNDDVSTSFSISSVTSNSYRTASAGNWLGSTGLATWERFVSGSWSSSAAPSSSTSNVVYIRHTISSNGSFGNSINLVIESGGNFTVTGSSTAASVWVKTGGYFKMGSTCTIATGGNFELESGATFEYNGSTTTPATTIWNGTEVFRTGSLVLITNWDDGTDPTIYTSGAISTTTVGSYSALFGNLKIQISAIGSTWSPVLPSLTGINLTHGYFEIANNDAADNINLMAGGTANITIGGDFIISGSNTVQGKTGAGDLTINVKGNFSQTGTGIFRLSSSTSNATNIIMNVDGDFSVSGTGAIFDMQSSSTANTVTSTVNLKGSLTKPSTSTMLQTNSAGVANVAFNFTGSGTTQNINVNATSTDMLRYRFFVKNGASIKVINQNWQFNDQSVLTVESGGTLDFGFNGTIALNLTEVGASPVTSFILNSGGTIKITSIDGISSAGTNTGNVRLDTRTYDAAATYHYIGITPSQVTGNGLPTAGSTKKVIVELDALTTTLTPTASFIVNTSGGQLDIRQGTFVETSSIGVSGTGSLVMSGGLFKSSILSTTLPQLTGTYSLTGGTVELNGAGAQVLRGARAYRGLTFSTSGTKTVTSAPTSVTGTVLISGSAILDVSINTMGGVGTDITMTGTSRYKTAGTGTKPDAQGTYTLGSGTTMEFSNTTATQQNIRLSPSYFNIDISGSSVGTSSTGSSILMQAGSTFNVRSTATFKLINTTGFSGGSSTAVSSTNNPTISLVSGSTIEYNGTTQSITNQAAYSNLTLSGTGTKTAPTGTLTINGNFTNNSTFSASTGTILLSGTTQQTLGGSASCSFNNLTLSNSNGAILTIAQNISGILSLTNGTFNTNANTFTLLAIQNGSAFTNGRIGQISATADIIGDVTVEQYAVRSGATNWGLLGAPIDNSSALTFSSWNDDFYITCTNCPDGSAAGGQTFTSLYSYDESATGVYDDPASYIPINDISESISLTKGYWVYLGNGLGTPIKFNVTGSVAKANTVSVDIPLTYNNYGSTDDDGWNLISNPLPCPISWTALLGSTTNIDNGIYVYNSNTGAYASYVAGVSSPALGAGGIGDEIPISQGFYVHSTGATLLTALETNKVENANPDFLRVNPMYQQPLNYVAVPRLFLTNTNGLKDEVAFHFNSNATAAFDNKYDAFKLINDPTLPYITSITSDGKLAGINGLPSQNGLVIIDAKTKTTGLFTFSLGGDTINGTCVTLYDSYTGVITNLTTSSYTCTLYDTTTVPRFKLTFTSSVLNASTSVTQPICSAPDGAIVAVGLNGGPWNYVWKDNNGVPVKSTLNKINADTLTQLNGGVYTLEMSTSGQCDNYTETFSVDTVVVPNAQFTASADTVDLALNGNVYFEPVQNSSFNYSWNFGDGIGVSSQENPTYEFISEGVFQVILNVSSQANCANDFTKNIVVVNSAIATVIEQSSWEQSTSLTQIEPSIYLLSLKGIANSNCVYSIFDVSGKLIFSKKVETSQSDKILINLSNYSTGLYMLNINDGSNQSVNFKLTN